MCIRDSKERMDVVERCYSKMKRYRNLVSYYTNKNISVRATVPVTKLEASLMRYWMVPQSSSARPIRPKGVWRITSCPRSV